MKLIGESRPYLYRTAGRPSSSRSCTATGCCRSRGRTRGKARTRHRSGPASRSYTCQTQTHKSHHSSNLFTLYFRGRRVHFFVLLNYHPLIKQSWHFECFYILKRRKKADVKKRFLLNKRPQLFNIHRSKMHLVLCAT